MFQFSFSLFFISYLSSFQKYNFDSFLFVEGVCNEILVQNIENNFNFSKPSQRKSHPRWHRINEELPGESPKKRIFFRPSSITLRFHLSTQCLFYKIVIDLIWMVSQEKQYLPLLYTILTFLSTQITAPLLFIGPLTFTQLTYLVIKVNPGSVLSWRFKQNG